MNKSIDPKENKPTEKTEVKNVKETTGLEKKQQQTDPNLTELKGLTDPNEKLEVEGTDNDV
jgi:hypothetical protein